MALTTFVTQSIGGVLDTRIAMSSSIFNGNLTGSYIVRPHGIDPSWTKLRIGVRFTTEQGTVGTFASFTFQLAVGLCNGTGSVGSAYVKNAFYVIWVPSSTTYTSASGANMAYFNVGSNTVTEKIINNTLTFSTPFGFSPVCMPADPTAATRRMFFVDIIKGSPNWSAEWFAPSSPIALPDVTAQDFLNIMPLTQPVFDNHSFSVVGGSQAFSEISGTLDNAFVYWNLGSPRGYVCDFAVARLG